MDELEHVAWLIGIITVETFTTYTHGEN